jgi:hypothetical protein
MKTALLDKQECNVFVVDYPVNKWANQARADARLIGGMTAYFIEFLDLNVTKFPVI